MSDDATRHREKMEKRKAVQDAEVIVHFAGILFKPRPEKFLPETNTVWFSNLVDAALEAGVRRIILISFPQVEGPTSVEHPGTGRLDRDPLAGAAAHEPLRG